MGDDDNASGDGGEDDGEENKLDYKKKEWIANLDYKDLGSLKEVQDSIISDSRPKIQMKIARARREYGQEGFNLIDKDASEAFYQELKCQLKNPIIYMPHNNKKVLEIGLQAAHKMKEVKT